VGDPAGPAQDFLNRSRVRIVPQPAIAEAGMAIAASPSPVATLPPDAASFRLTGGPPAPHIWRDTPVCGSAEAPAMRKACSPKGLIYRDHRSPRHGGEARAIIRLRVGKLFGIVFRSDHFGAGNNLIIIVSGKRST